MRQAQCKRERAPAPRTTVSPMIGHRRQQAAPPAVAQRVARIARVHATTCNACWGWPTRPFPGQLHIHAPFVPPPSPVPGHSNKILCPLRLSQLLPACPSLRPPPTSPLAPPLPHNHVLPSILLHPPNSCIHIHTLSPTNRKTAIYSSLTASASLHNYFAITNHILAHLSLVGFATLLASLPTCLGYFPHSARSHLAHARCCLRSSYHNKTTRLTNSRPAARSSALRILHTHSQIRAA